MQYFALSSRSIVILAVMQIMLVVGSILFASMKMKFYNYPPGSMIHLIYSYGFILLLVPLILAGIVSFYSNSNDASEDSGLIWNWIYIFSVFVLFVMFLYSIFAYEPIRPLGG